MKFVSFLNRSLLENSEFDELIDAAKKKQLAMTKEKIDDFNKAYGILIHNLEKEEAALLRKRKINALKNGKRYEGF